MLTFTPIKIDDLEFLNDVRNSCSKEFLHDPRTFTLKETTEWFLKTNPNYWIILKEGKRIGYFRTSNYSNENKNIYIGADIHEDYRGMGLGYKSYIEFLPFLFKRKALHKISLEVLSTNDRAINLYKKIGFVTEGTKRDEVLKDNTWLDSIIMSVLKNEIDEGL